MIALLGECGLHRPPVDQLADPDADCTCPEPLATWHRAKADSANGELTYRAWGDYDKVHIEHGWWLNPTCWGLGLDVDFWWRTDGRVSLGVTFGPFAWAISLCKPVTR